MSVGRIRRPAVAGYYYPAEPEALRGVIETLTEAPPEAIAARGVIVPHGSYRQAGAILGATLSRITMPRRCIILGPSHAAEWMRWSLMTIGAYRTPLGDTPIDESCAEALRSRCPFLQPDPIGQRGEHAIEVVLPFLQQRGPADLTIVPIVIGAHDDEELVQLSGALAQVVRLQEEPVLLVASSDMSHAESWAAASRQDRQLIDLFCALDGFGLRRTLRRGHPGMCGSAAAACVLEAAKLLGARAATLVSYGTSAEAGGDPDSVTGYAGIVIR